MTELESLQAIVADETRSAEERKLAAEHILKLQNAPDPTPAPQETIADDDPELLAFMANENKARHGACVLKPLTLEQAKGLFLYQRLVAKLYAIASDESKPMPERVAAVQQMRGKRAWPNGLTTFAGSELAALKDEEVVERLTPHPHQARLRELHDFIHDAAQRTELQPWEPRIEACKEFRRLKAEYPRRYVGCDLLSDADQTIAYWYSRNDPERGKTLDTYRIVMERAGQK